jgi:hypothetical protein
MQVRQPIYRASVGRWKNYAKSLAFLFDKLQATPATIESPPQGLG